MPLRIRDNSEGELKVDFNAIKIPEIIASVRHPLSPGSCSTHILESFSASQCQRAMLIVLTSYAAAVGVNSSGRLGAGAADAHTAAYMDS